MKTKRLILSVLVIMFSVMFLGACDLFGGKKEDPLPEPPKPIEENITKYFNSSVYTEYIETKTTAVDQNGNDASFIALLDRQIDILSQDILYRLVSVYGVGAPVITNDTGTYGEPANSLKDNFTGQAFAKGSNKALVTNYTLISKPTSANATAATYKYSNGTEVKAGSSAVASPNISQAASFAYALSGGTWNENITIGKQFNLNNAINGGYKYEGTGFTTELGNSVWNWSNSTELLASEDGLDAYLLYHDYYISHFENLKLAIANLIANGSATGNTYSEAVNKITHLGFKDANKTNIKNYVLNTVIGTSVINSDNSNKPSDNIKQTTDLTNEQHSYKAYNLIVGAIVDSAFNNTFSNTTDSFYNIVEKTALVTKTLSYNSLNNKNFTLIRLTPKTTIPVTKLVLKVSNVTPANLNISYSIFKSSGLSIVENKAVAKSNQYTITLDFSAYKSSTLTTNSYIEIKFNNTSGLDYNIILDSYFNLVN